MINTICGEWVFNAERKEASEAADTVNFLQFNIWIVLEACVFLSYISAATFYLFIRGCAVHQYNLTSRGHNIATNTTDTLEQNSITMECYESFFAPLFATALMRTHLFDYDYHELMANHQSCKRVTAMFIYLSLIQVVLATFLNFVPMWRRRHIGYWNEVCPTIHYISFLLLIFVLPCLKIVTYCIALITTDI